MSEKALDLRGSVRIVRRRIRLVSAVAVVGLLAGGAYSALRPPLLTSTTLIVLPQTSQAATNAAAASSSGGSNTYMATQAVIARSTPVLAAALPSVHPAMSLDALRADIQVVSLTGYIMSISAQGKIAADAEATANAVAKSYLAYVNSPSSPIPQASARILQPAGSASGENRWVALATIALIGALAGALIGIIAALALSRRDKRLWKRDEIAGSIGVPVLASLAVRHPRDAADWSRLLEDYEPLARDAWRIRQTLQHLGIADPSGSGSVVGPDGANGGRQLFVLSLASDPGAIAIGPQLAVAAAAMGIPTALIIGPQEDIAATAALRTACSMPPPQSAKRLANLHVVADQAANFDARFHAELSVYVAVIDDRNPQTNFTAHGGTAVLGVSAGAATADQIAQVAVNAAAHGGGIAGILVADPEPADHTTGLVPQLARPAQRALPTRLSGSATEIRQ